MTRLKWLSSVHLGALPQPSTRGQCCSSGAHPERSRSRPKNAPAEENKDRESVGLGVYLCVVILTPSVAASAVCAQAWGEKNPTNPFFSSCLCIRSTLIHIHLRSLVPPAPPHFGITLLPRHRPPGPSPSPRLLVTSLLRRFLRPWPRRTTMHVVSRYGSRSHAS